MSWFLVGPWHPDAQLLQNWHACSILHLCLFHTLPSSVSRVRFGNTRAEDILMLSALNAPVLAFISINETWLRMKGYTAVNWALLYIVFPAVRQNFHTFSGWVFNLTLLQTEDVNLPKFTSNATWLNDWIHSQVSHSLCQQVKAVLWQSSDQLRLGHSAFPRHHWWPLPWHKAGTSVSCSSTCHPFWKSPMYDLQLWATVRLPPSDYGKLINELEGEGIWQWIIGWLSVIIASTLANQHHKCMMMRMRMMRMGMMRMGMGMMIMMMITRMRMRMIMMMKDRM